MNTTAKQGQLAVAADSMSPSIPGIEVDRLCKYFVDDRGNKVKAVDDVNLSVPQGEFLVLLGPSGCGKTTLLRCLAGLETPDKGIIRLSGRTVFDGGHADLAADRGVGMVFQSYALWPHMTVEQNIAYPLLNLPKAVRPSKDEVRVRVHELLSLMQLEEHAQRRPSQLSGGQQQRVALARAIAAGNRVVLFDEPLSNIDAKVRETLRLELRTMQRKIGFTAVYVTHDQTEAMELADRIAVMRDGKVVQIGSPEDIYQRPETRYVADFVGTSNLIPGKPTAHKDRAVMETPLGPISVSSLPDGNGPFVVATRAHSWWIRAAQPDSHINCWRGKVISRAYFGWYTEFVVQIDESRVRIWDEHGSSARQLSIGDEAWVGVSPENCLVVTDDGN